MEKQTLLHILPTVTQFIRIPVLVSGRWYAHALYECSPHLALGHSSQHVLSAFSCRLRVGSEGLGSFCASLFSSFSATLPQPLHSAPVCTPPALVLSVLKLGNFSSQWFEGTYRVHAWYFFYLHKGVFCCLMSTVWRTVFYTVSCFFFFSCLRKEGKSNSYYFILDESGNKVLCILGSS